MQSHKTAWDVIRDIPHIPMDIKGNVGVVASNSCARRWLDNKSILINGEFPKHDGLVEFPITELVFFPKSKRRCTMV